MGDLAAYLKQSFRQSFAFYERGEAMASLGGGMASLVMTVVTAVVGRDVVAEVPGSVEWAIYLATWFLFLVLVVTPFRMWRAQRKELDGLKRSLSQTVQIENPRRAFSRSENTESWRLSIAVRNVSTDRSFDDVSMSAIILMPSGDASRDAELHRIGRNPDGARTRLNPGESAEFLVAEAHFELGQDGGRRMTRFVFQTRQGHISSEMLSNYELTVFARALNMPQTSKRFDVQLDLNRGLEWKSVS
jgi:ABC-type multidrug transport system fused ATPase/permease subunit